MKKFILCALVSAPCNFVLAAPVLLDGSSLYCAGSNCSCRFYKQAVASASESDKSKSADSGKKEMAALLEGLKESCSKKGSVNHIASKAQAELTSSECAIL